jgi:hypothetical protein
MFFAQKLAQAATLAAISSLAEAKSSADIGLITVNDDFDKAFEANDFTFISFFSEDAESKAVDALMEDVKAYIDEQIEKGNWTDRNIGWYRADTGAHPELAEDGNPI